ncbi:hypothetical protein [Arthrobacter flavus]|uniref:Uncharacterized protein n=1 Tax=Arthrobacter flavus TaxID=95172 RepID=A0ABW4QA78_9MICC
MAVSVILDLTGAVSIKDLEKFLDFVPEGFDSQRDLRVASTDRFRSEGLPDFLKMPLPTAAIETGKPVSPIRSPQLEVCTSFESGPED